MVQMECLLNSELKEVLGNAERLLEAVKAMATVDEALPIFSQLAEEQSMQQALLLVTGKDQPQLCFYFIQLCNILLVKYTKCQNSLFLTLQTSECWQIVFKTAYLYNGKLAQQFTLVYNLLKRMKLNAEQLTQFCTKSLAFRSLLNTFFNHTVQPTDGDSALEFFIYLKCLISDTVQPASIYLLLFNVLDDMQKYNLLNYIQISLDNLVSNRRVYSVVQGLDAEPLVKDEDFKDRIDPSETSKYFLLQVSDVQFLIDVVTKVLNEPNLSLSSQLPLANEILAILINATFVGGYNKKLQQMLCHGSLSDKKEFSFLGTLSEALTRITKLKFECKTPIKEPEFATNIIRLASNLVHANPAAQDFLLDHEYLPFYLSNSVRDDLNPHSKEVIVVFVRYVTEGNLRARGMISALSVADFVKENANLINKFESI